MHLPCLSGHARGNYYHVSQLDCLHMYNIHMIGKLVASYYPPRIYRPPFICQCSHPLVCKSGIPYLGYPLNMQSVLLGNQHSFTDASLHWQLHWGHQPNLIDIIIKVVLFTNLRLNHKNDHACRHLIWVST